MAYTVPTTRSTGELIDAADWNTDLTNNVVALSKQVDSPPWGPHFGVGVSTNQALYMKANVQPARTIGSFAVFVEVSSGNWDVGIYADSGDAPGAALWRRGGLASPGTSQRGISISAGSPTTLSFTSTVVWFAVSADNATVKFAGNVYLPAGLVYQQASAYPLPATATPSGYSTQGIYATLT